MGNRICFSGNETTASLLSKAITVAARRANLRRQYEHLHTELKDLYPLESNVRRTPNSALWVSSSATHFPQHCLNALATLQRYHPKSPGILQKPIDFLQRESFWKLHLLTVQTHSFLSEQGWHHQIHFKDAGIWFNRDWGSRSYFR